MQINQYPRITKISDGDLFLVQTASDDAFKSIAASDLQSYFGSVSTGTGGTGGTGTSPSIPKARNFVNSGDTNGVFYYLGTNLGVSAWSNPCPSSMIITASSVQMGSVELLSDRTNDEFYTSSAPNSWIEFDLELLGLKCNYYSLQNRIGVVSDGHYLRNWQLQGSNDDGKTWVVLDNQVNNTILSTPSQWLSLPVNSDVSYSKFRIYETDVNSFGYYYICLGEVELYGYLIDQPVSNPVEIGTIT